jgi:hypothetical protein
MNPVTVTTSIARPREEVFDFLDDLSNHAGFLDHFLVDWDFSGPARGVGAKGHARISAPGSQEWTDFEVVDSKRPERIVEDGIGAGGKRHTRGTYYLSDRPDGGTDVAFKLEWLAAPRTERLIPPLSRLFIRRTNGKALRRLQRQLERG